MITQQYVDLFHKFSKCSANILFFYEIWKENGKIWSFYNIFFAKILYLQILFPNFGH